MLAPNQGKPPVVLKVDPPELLGPTTIGKVCSLNFCRHMAVHRPAVRSTSKGKSRAVEASLN